MHWLESPPQANETARSAPLIAVGILLTQKFGMPLRLLELGTSARLNLRWDLLSVTTDQEKLGLADAGMDLCYRKNYDQDRPALGGWPQSTGRKLR